MSERVVIERRSRATGTTVLLVDRGSYTTMMPTGELNPEHRWETICAEHGGVCSHETRRLAEQWLSHPDEWCEDCMYGEGSLAGKNNDERNE